MRLWKISQEQANGYDTYDAAIVAAETEDEARRISPSDYLPAWALPEFVTVQLIGEAIKGTEAGIILASFNAG